MGRKEAGELGEAFLQYLARPCAPEAKAERRQKFASIVRAEMPNDMSS